MSHDGIARGDGGVGVEVGGGGGGVHIEQYFGPEVFSMLATGLALQWAMYSTATAMACPVAAQYYSQSGGYAIAACQSWFM